MSYRKALPPKLSYNLRLAAVCGATVLGSYLTYQGLTKEPKVVDVSVENAGRTGQKATEIPLEAIAGLISFGAAIQMYRNAKRNSENKNGGNKKDAPINIADLKKAQQGR